MPPNHVEPAPPGNPWRGYFCSGQDHLHLKAWCPLPAGDALERQVVSGDWGNAALSQASGGKWLKGVKGYERSGGLSITMTP